MSGQFQELLRDVARDLKGVDVLLKELRASDKERELQVIELIRQVSALEEAKKWTGDERRKTDERLGTGDKTFEKLNWQIKEAETTAERAYDNAKAALDAIEAHTEGHGETKSRSKGFFKWAELLFPILWPVILSGVTWLFTTLHFIAKLAEAAKQSGGGHP